MVEGHSVFGNEEELWTYLYKFVLSGLGAFLVWQPRVVWRYIRHHLWPSHSRLWSRYRQPKYHRGHSMHEVHFSLFQDTTACKSLNTLLVWLLSIKDSRRLKFIIKSVQIAKAIRKLYSLFTLCTLITREKNWS